MGWYRKKGRNKIRVVYDKKRKSWWITGDIGYSGTMPAIPNKKGNAVQLAREIAKGKKPSILTIEKMSGKISKKLKYD